MGQTKFWCFWFVPSVPAQCVKLEGLTYTTSQNCTACSRGMLTNVMASIDLTQARSVVGSAYRVANTITNPVGMPPEVFVFHTANQAFSRVASTSDLSTLPATREDAQTGNIEYYRSSIATRDFELLDDAQDFAAMVRNRLPALVKEYNAVVTSFVGTTTTTVTS